MRIKQITFFHVLIFLFIMGIGVSLRGIVLSRTVSLQRDTVVYITDAKLMRDVPQKVTQKIRIRQFFYTWILHFFSETQTQSAALGISMVLGILQIIVIGLLAYELSGCPEITWSTMLFAAVSPPLVQYSVSGLREPGMLFFGTLGVWLSIWAQKCKLWIPWPLAGIFITIGILFRVEGGEMGLSAFIFLILAHIRNKISRKYFLKYCGGLVGGGLLVIFCFFLMWKYYAV